MPLLAQMGEEIKKTRAHLTKKKVLVYQYNARVRTCPVAMANLHELKFESLPHPPISPDAAPSGFFLFPNMKKWLAGKILLKRIKNIGKSLGEVYRATRKLLKNKS